MSKPASLRRLQDNEAMAKLTAMRISPQKLNLVAGLIRGCRVAVALDRLLFSKKRAAKEVHKLLMSAISNAENNHGLDIDRLVVAEAWVGKAFVMRRFHARARGRGVKILKPFSQMSIIVREQEVSR
jgi:large subunit ribosomal protein L22